MSCHAMLCYEVDAASDAACPAGSWLRGAPYGLGRMEFADGGSFEGGWLAPREARRAGDAGAGGGAGGGNGREGGGDEPGEPQPQERQGLGVGGRAAGRGARNGGMQRRREQMSGRWRRWQNGRQRSSPPRRSLGGSGGAVALGTAIPSASARSWWRRRHGTSCGGGQTCILRARP